MARGAWDDFTSKWGFSEGLLVEEADYQVRDLICQKLNEHPAIRAGNSRAVPWNRPGVHNSCMILHFPNPDGKTDEALVKAWQNGQLEECSLPDLSDPDFPDDGLEELIGEAYDEVQDAPLAVLRELVDSVEAVGVDYIVDEEPDGLDYPDLLLIYEKACQVLGRTPQEVRDE